MWRPDGALPPLRSGCQPVDDLHRLAPVIFEVFARKTRGEPLRHIGNLNAPDTELARVYAFNTYDEEKWFDMWVVARQDLFEVFNRGDGDGTAASQRPAGGG